MVMVIIRLTGLFLFTPMLSSGSVPYQFKAVLALMFALAIYPFVPPMDPNATIDLITLVPLLFAELIIGVAIGLIASLPLLAVQMGGYLMGYQIGLSLAESFNPELQANGSVLGDLLFYLAAFIFIGVGGLDILFATLAESFNTIPVGAFTSADVPLDLFVSVLASGFDLAMRVATPIVVVVSMLMVSMGFVMKTMPQINIMSIGFAAQIVAGLAILFFSVNIIGVIAGDEIHDTLEQIGRWVRSFATAGLGRQPNSAAVGGFNG
jgi:flagellar biosynthetic protein FliR